MKKPGVVCMIPARYGSTRLPGKPLVEIHGRPMILHVLERASRIPGVDRVVVATDDERIRSCVTGAGGEAYLTDSSHPSGTDRIAEVSRMLDLAEQDVVVNVQGDQPLLSPGPVTAIIERLLGDPGVVMTTPACPLGAHDAENPNRVKVVVDRWWRALYFSRARIPYDRDGVWGGGGSGVKGSDGDRWGYLRHIGLYAYRQGFLEKFVALPPGILENVERLEQLRALENGYSIGVVLVEEAPPDVDTPEDLDAVKRLKVDRLKAEGLKEGRGPSRSGPGGPGNFPRFSGLPG